MNRPWTLPAGLLGLLLLAACSEATDAPAETSEPPRAAHDAPDLLLVVIDTLRADHLSCYGYPRPTTPGLDALAAGGTRFADVTSQSSWTLPSMASMLTGRRMFVNARKLPADVPSLAERLQQAGYQTLAFIGNPALTSSPEAGYMRGFDVVVDRKDTGLETWDADDLAAAVDGYLATAAESPAPRLVYLHFLDPHWPYAPDSETELLPPPHLRDDVLETWMAVARTHQHVGEHFNADRLTILDAIDAYDREIRHVDEVLQALLPRLERPGRERLVVVASDHGEGLWEHEHHPRFVPEDATLVDMFFRDHSYHMFQELLATPLLLSGPGFDGGRVVGEAVENVDIAPTLLRAAGLPDDPALEGRALQDVLAGAAPERPWIYSHSNEATVVRRTADDAKLIWPSDTGFSFGMPIMLFDLAHDPHERTNVDRAREDATRDLIRQREVVAAGFHLFDGEAVLPDDPSQMEALRALGYTGEAFAVPADRSPAGGSGRAGSEQPPPGSPPSPSSPGASGRRDG